MLEVGALTTMTPALVAAGTSTLSRPDPGAGDDLEVLRGGDRLGVHLRGRADQHRVDVGEGGQQRRAVGAVDVADLEVGAEGIDGGGREFLGDEDDRLGHVSVLRCGSRMVAGRPGLWGVPWRPGGLEGAGHHTVPGSAYGPRAPRCGWTVPGYGQSPEWFSPLPGPATYGTCIARAARGQWTGRWVSMAEPCMSSSSLPLVSLTHADEEQGQQRTRA